jgi:6-phosphogluconate dehydrogenase
MALIQAGSRQHNWSIDLASLARIWKGGCIIRAAILNKIEQAYQTNPDLSNLMLDREFTQILVQSQIGWRNALTTAQQAGIPLPAMSASLAYFDSYRTADLPQNLTQAQRDFFGSHLYERIDDPGAGPVHTDWITLTGTDVKG